MRRFSSRCPRLRRPPGTSTGLTRVESALSRTRLSAVAVLLLLLLELLSPAPRLLLATWPMTCPNSICWIVPTTMLSLTAVAPGDVMAVMELGHKDILTGSLMSALTTRRNLPTPTPPDALVMSPLADLPAAG